MPRLDFRGGAAKCTTSAALTSGATTIALSGDTGGWPTGASSRKFVAIIDRGVVGKMEKVLCSALTSGVLTIDVRGYDGTTAVAHDAGADVEHGFGASVFDDLSGHVYDTGRDDHEQYLLTDGTRAPSNVEAWTGTDPVSVGDTNEEGTSTDFARADHVHNLAELVVTEGKIQDGAVTTDKIADESVTAAKLAPNAIPEAGIADGAVTFNKLAVGQKIVAGQYSGTLDGSNNLTQSVPAFGGFAPTIVVVSPTVPSGGGNQGFPVITGWSTAGFTLRYLNTAGSMAGVTVAGTFIAVF